MNIRRISLIFLTVMVAFFSAAFDSSIARASDVYIAQASSGANSGADCADTHAYTWFNAASNWGSNSGQIGPGTTVHLCGIITSELTFLGSGTSGSPIELLFEKGAAIQISPGADANGIINLGSYSYILIDGGANTPCGWSTATNTSEGACNGQIEDMLYGSSGATCPGGSCTTQASAGNLIQGTGSNIEIRNLQIGPAYIHTTTGNGGNDTGGAQCFQDTNGSNWNIHDSKLHDGEWCAVFAFTGGTMSNITMTNNEMYNNSHMVALGGANAGNLNGFTFSGNFTHDMYNWDTTSDADHADAIHLFGATGTARSLLIYNNIFGGNTGGDITGQIFSEAMGGTSNVVIFNNLFDMSTSPDLGAANHAWGPAQCDSGCYFLNNTIARQTTTGGNLDLGYSTYNMVATIENNVDQGGASLVNVAASSPSLTLNYNAYGPNGGDIWVWEGAFYTSLASWRSASGEGSGSFYNSSTLGLSASYKPNSGSLLIGAGVNICTQNPTFCADYPAIEKDMAGNSRPGSGNWDIGAYQDPATGTGSSTPSPPTGLTAVVQ